MEAPCVRVERARGEETRQRLDEAGLLEHELAIEAEEGWLYIPVTDPGRVPSDLEVVVREPPERSVQRMPADVLGYEPSYERLGDVVLLDEDDPDRAAEIAAAVMESDLPVRTVLDRASKVKGEHRVRDWEVLAGEGTEPSEARRGSEDVSSGTEASDARRGSEDVSSGTEASDASRGSEGTPSGTEVVHREYGSEYALDLADVYFSPRLATERHRVAEQVQAGERAFDMFAGVGPYAVPFAKRGAEVVAVDVNPDAVEYLRENLERNDVADRVTAIRGDVREVAPDYRDWADRIVMNLPHSADEFLESAVTIAGDDCVLHYYDIQHEDDPFGPGEAAIRAAAEPEYEVSVATRHVVRSYAPHELNVCLDVRLEK